MGNSTIKLEAIVDDCWRQAELEPALATGGSADEPALSMANDVMNDILSGGPDGARFNWKWNRLPPFIFTTISLQQDYAFLASTDIAWLEHGFAVDINSTAPRKQVIPIQVKRDLEASSMQTGLPTRACWMYNDQMFYGTWGQTQITSATGLKNPGANVVYTNPLGTAGECPDNPTTQIKDTNGNLLVLTQYGTCGSVEPTWPAAASAEGTAVTDGGVIWKVVNPKGQGIRLAPIPPETGVVWQLNIIAQSNGVPFTSLSQLLDPLPDDMVRYFKAGFFAQCYRRSPDPKVRAKFQQEYNLWLKSLNGAVKAGSREEDDFFIIAPPIIDSLGGTYLGPAYPFNGTPGSR